MKRDNKQIILERMQKLDPSFKPRQELNERAYSQAQQKAAGAAYAAKKGDIDPEELVGSSKEMYHSMSKSDLKDFASTKHDDIPKKVKNEAVDSSGVVEYVRDINGANPFTMDGAKYKYVMAKYPDGKNYIGVYRYDHDMVYAYDWFKDNVLGEDEERDHDYLEKEDGNFFKIKLKDMVSLYQKIENMLEDDDDLPAWVQEKLSLSHHNAEALYDYYLMKKGEKDTDLNNMELEEGMINEKSVPNDPSKWSYAKSQAKKKFDVYPSAYANAWASKKYKELGGTWRKGKK